MAESLHATWVKAEVCIEVRGIPAGLENDLMHVATFRRKNDEVTR